jgi:glycerate dehydrogenase
MPTQRRIESIVFLERNTFKISFRKPDFEHEWVEYAATAEGEVVERLRDASIAICNKVALGKESLSKLPQLKLIAVAATGTDNVDLAYCRTHNIAVCNTRGYAVSSLPEHALMLMFALRRNLIAYRDDVRDGRWQEAKQFCLLDHSISDLGFVVVLGGVKTKDVLSLTGARDQLSADACAPCISQIAVTTPSFSTAW